MKKDEILHGSLKDENNLKNEDLKNKGNLKN